MIDNTALGINHWWAKLAVEELTRSGVRDFCICPGARSSALALALAQHELCRNVVHFDERGAGFFALGQAKGSGRPSCVVCTSGSALANLLPAVIEAQRAQVALIVLSADRPVELRDSGANQTIDQVKFFGQHVNWSFTLPAAQQDLHAPFLLSVIDQAVFRAAQQPAGPVHINFEFREPLLTGEEVSYPISQELGAWAASSAPYTAYSSGENFPCEADFEQLAKRVERSRAGIIVASQLGDPAEQAAVTSLARHLQWPVVAELSSGLRHSRAAPPDLLAAHYGFYLGHQNAAAFFQADLVLHFGAAPLSRVLSSYLGNLSVDYAVINSSAQRLDFGCRISQRIIASADLTAAYLNRVCAPRPSPLCERFQRAERASLSVFEDQRARQDSISEIFATEAVFALAPESSAIFLGNSLPVRQADLICAPCPKDLRLGFQRGVSGIDGTVADACGFAFGAERRTTALLGDLACLHDLNSLALAKNVEQGITFVVFNNDGGGIFSYLPVLPKLAEFERFFAAEHGRNFENGASMFGLEYYTPSDIGAFCEIYKHCSSSPGPKFVELFTDKRRNVALHQILTEEICSNLWR